MLSPMLNDTQLVATVTRAPPRRRDNYLVNEMQQGTLGCYVRHGDKYYEATEYPLKDGFEGCFLRPRPDLHGVFWFSTILTFVFCCS